MANRISNEVEDLIEDRVYHSHLAGSENPPHSEDVHYDEKKINKLRVSGPIAFGIDSNHSNSSLHQGTSQESGSHDQNNSDGDLDILAKVLSELENKTSLNYEVAAQLFEQIPSQDLDKDSLEMANVLKNRLNIIKELDQQEKELKYRQQQLEKQQSMRNTTSQQAQQANRRSANSDKNISRNNSKKSSPNPKSIPSAQQSKEQFYSNNNPFQFTENNLIKSVELSPPRDQKYKSTGLTENHMPTSISYKNMTINSSHIIHTITSVKKANSSKKNNNITPSTLFSTLNKNSNKIILPNSNSNHDKFECTFHPIINKNAEKLSKRNQLDSNYSVRYLYQDFLERKEKIKDKKEKEINSQKEVAEKSKIGSKSQRIIMEKIDKMLKFLLEGFQEGEFISYDSLGMLFVQIGLFRAFQFQKDQNQTSLFLQDRRKVDAQRLQSEIKFLEQFYRIFSIHHEKDGIPKALLFDLLMILFEKKIAITEAEVIIKDTLIDHFGIQESSSDGQEQLQILQTYLDSARLGPDSVSASEQWDIVQIIMNFRRLHDDTTSLMEWYASKNNNILGDAHIDNKNKSNQLSLNNTSNNNNNNNNNSNVNNLNKELRFHPIINKKSKMLDQCLLASQQGNDNDTNNLSADGNNNNNQKTNKTRFELLYEHSKQLQLKRKEQKELIQKEQQINCTFKPTVNQKKFNNLNWYLSNNLSNSAGGENKNNLNSKNGDQQPEQFLNIYQKLYQQHLERSVNMEEVRATLGAERIKQELQECTFKPNINYAIENRDENQQENVSNIKGVAQQLERLQKARAIQAEKDSFFERQRLNLSQSYSRFTETMPFSFDTNNNPNTSHLSQRLSTRKKEKDIIGNVDVNFSKGKKGRIIICKGDSPDELALNFAKIYSLSDEMRTTLKDMLGEYILKITEDLKNQEKNGKSQGIVGESHEEGQKTQVDGGVNHEKDLQIAGQLIGQNQEVQQDNSQNYETFQQRKTEESRKLTTEEENVEENVNGDQKNEERSHEQDSNRSEKGEEGEDGNRISSIDSAEAEELQKQQQEIAENNQESENIQENQQSNQLQGEGQEQGHLEQQVEQIPQQE